MASEDKVLVTFETRVRQLIFRFEELKKENVQLQQQLEEKNAAIEMVQKELEQKKADYNSLMMAKMVEISDGDMETAKSRLSKLIRDVNKCIALLKDEQ